MYLAHLPDSLSLALRTSISVCHTNDISKSIVLLFLGIQCIRKICYHHHSEGGLVVSSVEIQQHTLRIAFLERMCHQMNDEGERKTPMQEGGLHFSPMRMFLLS